MDWDEEFALQDFLKSELEERNCREQRGGQTDGKPREVVDKSAGRLGEEKEEEDGSGGGEERWMVVDTAGEAEAEVRGTSTPLSALLEAAQPGHGEARGGQGELGNSQSMQPSLQLLNEIMHLRENLLSCCFKCHLASVLVFFDHVCLQPAVELNLCLFCSGQKYA